VRSGAQGYLLKTIEPSALLDSLRGVLRGEAALSSGLAGKMMLEFARRAQRPAETVSRLAQLSAHEQDVLARVADGKSNKEIATALAIAENTVKSRLKRILEKLHLENRVQAAVFAHGHDWLTAPSGTFPVADERPVRRAS
jgi:DNA-binding NarL/FixJ family response regulator